MKTYKNLFERVTDFNNLYRAFVETSRGKRHQAQVQQFEYHLEERLWEIKKELEEERYRWGRYRSFWIYDPKKRLIKAAPFRDRIVHHAIYNVLEPLFECSYISDSYACLVGKGTLAAVLRYEEFMRRLGGSGYVLKCDISQYFPSVDHGVLKMLLRRSIGDKRVLCLLEGLIDTGGEGSAKGMPIGNLTSQLFANFYLSPLDHYIKEVLRRKYYIRYMDDFVILDKEKREIWEVLESVRVFLPEHLKLQLNPVRVLVTPIEKGLDFLGYVIYPGGHKRIRHRNVVNFRTRLKRLEDGHAKGESPFRHAR